MIAGSTPPHEEVSPMRRLIVLALLGGLAHAAETPTPHGWHVRYEGRFEPVDSHAPSAAFRLVAGESIHPELGARGWTATYRGAVGISEAGTYRFGVEAEGGDATLTAIDAGGRELGRAAAKAGKRGASAWVPLDLGDVTLVVTFERAARGDGRLRTTWEQQPGETGGFRTEPIPSSAVRVPASFESFAKDGILARDGRAMLERKGCTNCHARDAVTEAAVGLREAPVLDALAGRIRPDWVRRWLADPAAVRPGTDMPHVPDGAAPETVDDIVQYLFRDVATPPAPPDAHTGVLRRGRHLFHTLGCVACHGAFESATDVFSDPMLAREVADDGVTVPYGDLRGKWHPGALARFLEDPHAVRPDGSMPSFGLDREEAEALAGYLSSRFEEGAPASDAAPDVGADTPFVRDTAAAERGRHAFGALGCASCHRVEGAPDATPRLPLFDLDATRGCLDPQDRVTPRFDLTPVERRTLARGLRSAKASQGVAAPTDRALRTFRALSCTSCHRLDGSHGVRKAIDPYFITRDDRVDLGDEGRLPPDLSGVGFKLNTAWLHRVVEEGARSRPYMGARMPAFGPAAAALPETFAALDGVTPGHDLAAPPTTDASLKAGKHLVGRDGMSCITCHSYRDWPPAGSPGPSLNAFAERLRYEWWRAYIQDPARYKPGTRMPGFSTGRRSTVLNILDGDIYRQGDAMWTFFELGDEMPPPLGMQAASSLRIPVTDRPVVLRTFLEQAGSRGIAVGYPVGIHVGFDAEACRLADAWRGEFLDASGAWAGRGGQVVGGQGPRAWLGPKGPPFALGDRPDAWPGEVGRAAGYRFRGYRLDEGGVPTFLYEISGMKVGERIEPLTAPSERLRRTFRLDAQGDRTAWLNAGAGRVTVTESEGAEVTLHPVDGDETWIEVAPDGTATSVRFTVEVAL